ncbi:MAG: hypothetical protein GXO89_15650 [Chlorobi bacterium]|nr:hypothetical protein [Chlorobiota bacterium]
MTRNTIYLFMTLIALSSCFKEDDPLPVSPLKETTVELNQYYQFQAYFDLGKGETVASNDRNIWDLGFECKDSSWHITLNSSAFMLAANTGQTDFESVTDTTGLDWKYDKSDGNPDSTAIGNWFLLTGNDTVYKNNVYVINLGMTHLGVPRGLKKIVFTKVDKKQYALKYADLNGENYQEFIIEKKPGLNYTGFSFEGLGSQLTVEPPSNTWDLLFTQYTTLIFTDEGEPYPYLLNGVLLNYGKVEVVLDSLVPFGEIDLHYAQKQEFSVNKDAIGYEWKYLEGDPTIGGSYYYKVNPNEEHPNWTYIIKNRNGVYFKLMFTRFYNDFGDKGYPTFAFQVL